MNTSKQLKRYQLIVLMRSLLFYVTITKLFLNPVFAGVAINGEAGRILHLFDRLSPDRIALLSDQMEFTGDTTHVGLIFFSRSGQDYSQKMQSEISVLLNKDTAERIWVWGFSLVDKTTDSAAVMSPDKPRWIQQGQNSNTIFNLFGIKVFPTIFVVNSNFVIQDYLAGFPANTRLHLSTYLTWPNQPANKALVTHKKEQKKRNRQEHFAFELYKTGNIDGALKQLNRTTPLSVKAQLVKVYCLIQLERFSEASELLKELSVLDTETIAYTQALILYYQQLYNDALEKLSDQGESGKRYEIHYLRSLLQQELGKPKSGKKEYRKAKQIVGRDLQAADLLDVLR